MDVSRRILDLLDEVSRGEILLNAADINVPLKDLGVDSVALLRLLVAIEDDLGFEWSEDTPPTVFVSVASLSEFLASALSAPLRP